MTIQYPRDWAETYGFLGNRVDIPQAIRFVETVQSAQFGNLIASHNQNVDANRDPETDPAYNTEQELQRDFDDVLDWLRTLRDDGQQTISTQKVIDKIESETGYEFELN